MAQQAERRIQLPARACSFRRLPQNAAGFTDDFDPFRFRGGGWVHGIRVIGSAPDKEWVRAGPGGEQHPRGAFGDRQRFHCRDVSNGMGES